MRLKKSLRWRGVVLLLLCTVVLASCAPTHVCEEDDTVAFLDALGRTVRVSKTPVRTAALLGSFAEVWVLAGGELCAAAEDAWEDFGLELDGAVSLGGAHSPSLERLLASDPDFVIASASTASNLEMRETLEALGISVAYFDVDCFDDYLEMLRVCTDLTGRGDLYEQNGLRLREEIARIKAQYASKNHSERERKILLLRASSGTVKAKGSQGTILGEMLADMGCINVADGDNGLLENLSVEAVIREEPYHVFVVAMGGRIDAAEASLKNMMEENPAWATLEAVKGGRLHWMEKELFNLKPNDRWAEAYQRLYETLTNGKP